MPDFYIVPPRLMVGSFDRAAVVNSINTLKGDLTFTADPLTGVKLVTSGNNIQIGLIPNYFIKKAGDYVTGNIQFTPSGTNYGLQLFYNSSDPATGATGALYFNTTDNQLKIYDNTGWNVIQSTSGISVSYANQYYLRLDASNDPMQGDLDMGTYFLRVGNKATQVVAGTQGQIYFNTDTKKIEVYNGTAWVPIGLGITSITASTGLTSTQNPITSVATLSVNTAANFTWTGIHTFNSPVIFAAAGQTFNISNLFISGQTQGDLITYNGANWTRYGIGSTGQVLTVNTSGNGVTWADSTGSGSASSSGFATTAYNINLVQTTENNNFFLTFSKYSSGSGVALSSGVGLSFNPSTNTLTTSNIFGTLQTANQSNITGLGTITSGTWAATAITARYGGTGYTNYTSGTILVGAGSTFIALTPGTQNYVLTSSNIFSSGIGWSYTSGAAITSSPPSPANVSQFWWDNTDGSLSIYYDDGNGTAQWVEVIGGAALTGSGNGSGTVSSGNQYEVGYYASTGTTISGNSSFKYNSSANDTLILGGMTFVGSGNSSITVTSVGNGGQILSTWNTLNSGLALDALNASLRIVGDTNAGTTLVDLGIYDNSGFPTGNWNSKYLFPKATSAVFVNGLQINDATGSTTKSTGALIVSGGAGIAQSISIGGRLQLFNNSNYTAFVSSASGNTVYTLPATSPATGTSVLQSTSAGVMSWVAMTATGGGGAAISTSPPSSPSAGSFWWDSGSGSLKVYYVDPDSDAYWVDASGGNQYSKEKTTILLAAGYTPASSGADTVEIPVPYSSYNGTSILTFNVRRLFTRVGTSGSGSTVRFEVYTGTGAFIGSTIGDVSLSASSYEAATTSGFAISTVQSGNKIRLNFKNLGTEQYFTCGVELAE